MPGIDPISSIISGATGVIGGIFRGNTINKASKQLQQDYLSAADRTNKTTEQVNADITGAGRASGEQVRQAAGEGIARVDESTRNANALLDPYRQTGDQATNLLTAGTQAGGDFNKTPTLADLQIDPGYAFRSQQALKALEGSAAAKGGALGGGEVGQILGLNSNLSSQEYQNAFNRFQTSTQNRFNNLNTLAGRGAQTADVQGGNLINGAQFGANLNSNSATQAANFNNNAAIIAGGNSIQGTQTANDLMLGGSNARAQGMVGQQNALWGGINGAANAASGAFANNSIPNLLKNPATTTTIQNQGGYNVAGPQFGSRIG